MASPPIAKPTPPKAKPASPKADPGAALEAVLKQARLDLRRLPAYLKEVEAAAKGAKTDEIAKPVKPAAGAKGGKPSPPKRADKGAPATLTKLIESCRDAAKLMADDKQAFAGMAHAAQSLMKSCPAKPGASAAELGSSLAAVREFLVALKKQA